MRNSKSYISNRLMWTGKEMIVCKAAWTELDPVEYPWVEPKAPTPSLLSCLLRWFWQ